jgi:hypothetical protein
MLVPYAPFMPVIPTAILSYNQVKIPKNSQKAALSPIHIVHLDRRLIFENFHQTVQQLRGFAVAPARCIMCGGGGLGDGWCCLYMLVCMYVCMMCVCVYLCKICIYICLYPYLCMYIYTYAYTYTYTHTCVYFCL